MKQNGKDKIVFDTSNLKPLAQMTDVMDSKALMKILGKAIVFMHWVKHSSFVRLDSIVLEPSEVYLDAQLNDIKFICLPMCMGASETDCITTENSLFMCCHISYIIRNVLMIEIANLCTQIVNRDIIYWMNYTEI